MKVWFRSYLFYYRLFFIVLFLLMGGAGVGIVVLENYANISIITVSDIDKKALYTTLGVIGATGFIMAFSMIFLMPERRSTNKDRRLQSSDLDFPERRSNIDRRST